MLGDDPSARLETIPLLQPLSDWLAPGAAAPDPRLRAEGDDAPMMICLSSGTTGAPKAMVRTHRDHAIVSLAGRRRVGGAADRLLALTPFHFTYGLCHALQTLDGGGIVRVARPPLSFAELCRIIDREDITHLAITPTLARNFGSAWMRTW